MRKKYPSRVRFAKDIVAEVYFPEKQRGRVAILLSGAPSSPSKKERLEFLADYGYVAIFPRYRGTWESGGFFLEKSPAQDICDVVKEITKKRYVIDLATREKILVRASGVHLFGTSFGGTAVLLNSHLSSVKKVIAIAPVIDWSAEGEDEPFDEFVRYSREGYGGAYRTKDIRSWKKLIETDFYNPLAHIKKIDGRKVFIIHAKDDVNVPCDPVVPFAEKIGASYYLKPTGGHNLDMTHGFLWKKIETFLKKK